MCRFDGVIRKNLRRVAEGIYKECGFDLHFLSLGRKKIKVSMRSSPHRVTVHRTVTYEWVRIHHPFSSPNKKTPSKRMVFFAWWGKVDSNHRSDKQQIYSLSPLATREFPRIFSLCVGAGRRTRTPDLLITNQLLYRLSYTGGSHRTSLL